MCGIAGYYSIDGIFNQDDLVKMTNRIAHRGPDAEGFYNDGICGLGHRRLSIIDLNERSNQPMHSANDRFVIAYNGEVYNFREIGASLKESNDENKIMFKTSSDTEVILEAFSTIGIDCVHHLNGMFAFAIYDKLKKELYLIRDRLGIKPLLYYWDGKNLAFASEMKSLLQLTGIDKGINKNSVADFLHLGFIPAPNSIFKNIKKLLDSYANKKDEEELY